MLFRNIIMTVLVGMAGMINVFDVYAKEVYYDNFDTFENMLRSADLIILGTVTEVCW